MMKWTIAQYCSMVQTILGREKIDRRWSMHWSPLNHYWQYFDCDRVHITWRRQTKDGAGGGRGIMYTANYDIPHFNRISDEEKGCGMVGTAHAVFCAKTTLYGTKVWNCVRNIWIITKRKESCFFNNPFRWNLGVRLQTRTEISERGLVGKNSPRLQKFWCLASKVKQMMIMAYNYTGVIAAYMVPYGCTVDQHLYVPFLHKILRPKVRKEQSQMLDCAIILRDNAHLHIGTSVNTVFQEDGRKLLNHLPCKLDLSPLDYNLFPKLKELLRTICFSDLSELSLVMPWEIWWLNKTQLIYGIRSVHPSESVTITAFRREPAGRKGECLFNECWMNVMLIWDLFPFSSVITLRIPFSSMALRGDTRAACVKQKSCQNIDKRAFHTKGLHWKDMIFFFFFFRNCYYTLT